MALNKDKIQNAEGEGVDQNAAQNAAAVDKAGGKSSRSKTPDEALKAAGVKRWRKRQNAVGVDQNENSNAAPAVENEKVKMPPAVDHRKAIAEGDAAFVKYMARFTDSIQAQIAAQKLPPRVKKSKGAGVDQSKNTNAEGAVQSDNAAAEGVDQNAVDKDNTKRVLIGVKARRGLKKYAVEKSLSDYADSDFLNMPTLARLLQISLPTAHKVARQFKTLTRFQKGKRAHCYIRAFELKEFLARGGVDNV